MLATIHPRAAWCLPIVIAALATMAAGCATEPGILTLDDVPAPDTNTAVVLLDRLVLDAPHTILGRVPLVYGVDTGRIPHTLFAAHAFGADTASLVVVVSDLYTPGPVAADGDLNRVAWTGPGGTRFDPVAPCTIDVVQPFALGAPSLQRIHLACQLASGQSDVITVLAKTSRYHAGG